MNKDLYEILGVEVDATDEEIKSAYKKRAKECHPDMPEGSHEKQVELVEAYETLKRPETRMVYDKDASKGGKKRSIVDHATNLMQIMISDSILTYKRKGVREDDNILWDIKAAYVKAKKDSIQDLTDKKKELKLTMIIGSNIKRKDGIDNGNDWISMSIQKRIDTLNDIIKQYEFNLVLADFIIEQLKQYELHDIKPLLLAKYTDLCKSGVSMPSILDGLRAVG